MNIGVHHLSNYGNSINMSEAVVRVLQRMGHTVEANIQEHGQQCPPHWNALDFVLVLEADYVPPHFYSHLKIPKALWFTETENREDIWYDYPSRMAYSPHCFFVGVQDARKYRKTWLPHGVDTELFKPYPCPKTTPIGYFGSIYRKRIPFWQKIMAAGIPVTKIERVDCDRWNSFKLMARSICSCKMILALPAYSHSFTTRPTETMACGVPLIVPQLAEFARENERQWSVPPCYYDDNSLESLADAIVLASGQDSALLVKSIYDEHRLELRLQVIIDTVIGRRDISELDGVKKSLSITTT